MVMGDFSVSCLNNYYSSDTELIVYTEQPGLDIHVCGGWGGKGEQYAVIG